MNIFITICSCIVASIMTTLYCWKKFGKEEEERILQEQKERREKIRDSMLQTGSKRYSFPIDLKKATLLYSALRRRCKKKPGTCLQQYDRYHQIWMVGVQ